MQTLLVARSAFLAGRFAELAATRDLGPLPLTSMSPHHTEPPTTYHPALPPHTAQGPTRACHLPTLPRTPLVLAAVDACSSGQATCTAGRLLGLVWNSSRPACSARFAGGFCLPVPCYHHTPTHTQFTILQDFCLPAWHLPSHTADLLPIHFWFPLFTTTTTFVLLPTLCSPHSTHTCLPHYTLHTTHPLGPSHTHWFWDSLPITCPCLPLCLRFLGSLDTHTCPCHLPLGLPHTPHAPPPSPPHRAAYHTYTTQH